MALKNKISDIFNHTINHSIIHSSNQSLNPFYLLKSYLLSVIIILLLTQTLTFADIRYVSNTGSSTPPYTSWETASDSIQKAINISNFGDTIYVANGVYKEQVVMIPGLSLIGGGMDSCIIDTRSLVTSIQFTAVQLQDNCSLSGFQIIVWTNSDSGYAIRINSGNNSYIKSNKITNSGLGIIINNVDTSISANVQILNNFISGLSLGIYMFNSNAIVKNNFISIVNYEGIWIGAYFFNTHAPLIDSNYIVAHFGNTRAIYKSFGAKPTIRNNIIILKNGAQGIAMTSSDTVKVYNNIIYAEQGRLGLTAPNVPYLQLHNNYFTGNFDDFQNLVYILNIRPNNNVKNNVVTNGERGVLAWGSGDYNFQYNNVWNNDINYAGFDSVFEPDSTNISVDPMAMRDSVPIGMSTDSLDFRLQMYSPLIDAGDPGILDKDGSRSDIGAYGGPFGMSYQYVDMPPRPPHNITAVVDSETILIKWNPNTESDFGYYKLFRDTSSGFVIDSSNFVMKLTDSSYEHIIKKGVRGYYYKLTAVDNQGNESAPSEEIAVNLTSVNVYPLVISGYNLYQNYPNPFNPTTKISYRLKEPGYVKLYVYNVKGELIKILVNEYQETGYSEAEFFPESIGLASGVYIYQIMISSEKNIPVFNEMKKMVYLK